MTRTLSGVLAGVIFGVGLVLGGMTQPGKVLAFLDFTGDWDPSLAFVMGGAIAVFAPAYRWIVRNTMPVYAQKFLATVKGRIDPRLVIGSAVFGVGWGLAGFCPGPGLVSAGTGGVAGLVFVGAMLAGMLLFELYQRVSAGQQGVLPASDAEGPSADVSAPSNAER